MKTKHYLIGILIVILVVIAALILPDRINKPHTFTISSSNDADLTVWSVTFDGQTHVYMLPDIETPASVGTTDEILSVWADGILKNAENETVWLDLNRETGDYVSNPDVDLTPWDIPVAVDPENKIIYAFGHAAPSRELYAHYLNGNDPLQVGTLVADIIEPLQPLPNNGWPVFFVDRPSQAGALTIDNSPTRKLRVYRGGNVGGEVPDLLDLYFLQDNVIVNREDEGWILYEYRSSGVSQRMLSFEQIPGNPRPLARIDDTILVASESDEATGSILYVYGIYTRQFDEIWDSSVIGEAVKILSMDVLQADDYYFVVGILPELDNLILIRYKDGEWVEHVRAELSDSVQHTSIYFLKPEEDPVDPVTEEPEIEVEEEVIDLSAGDTENIFLNGESVGNI